MKHMNEDIEFDNIVISTYIINLEERKDRLVHIKKQFEGRDEFELNIFKAIKNEVGAVGLWQSIIEIVKVAIERDEDVIIICEDDHEFTPTYSKEYLLRNIIEAHSQGLAILSGGIGGFKQVVPVTINRWWVDTFWSTQFLVIYRDFFEAILAEPFEETDTADGKFSEMTSHKMVLYPFVSVQKDFGYSDVTKANDTDNGTVQKLFENSSSRIKRIADAYHKYQSKRMKTLLT